MFTKNQVVRFTTVPNGSYLSTGVDYEVISVTNTSVFFSRVTTGSGTNDYKSALRGCIWEVVPTITLPCGRVIIAP